MRPLEMVGGTLLWRGRGWFARNYDLVPDGQEDAEPFATLRWRETLIVWRSRGELAGAEGSWRFAPEGALGARVRIATPDGTEVGTFRRAWRSGTLSLADGRELRWRRAHWLKRVWRLEDANGFELVRVRPRFSWTRTLATVEIASTVAAAERVLFAGFGFYLVRSAEAAARRAGS